MDGIEPGSYGVRNIRSANYVLTRAMSKRIGGNFLNNSILCIKQKWVKNVNDYENIFVGEIGVNFCFRRSLVESLTEYA